MRRSIIDLHATAFQGDELEALWAPYAARVLRYGAVRYSFSRAEEDPLHFVQISDWVDPDDFDRYWYGPDMTEARERAAGMYQVPIVPHWAELVALGGA